jgi:hypothetical protein
MKRLPWILSALAAAVFLVVASPNAFRAQSTESKSAPRPDSPPGEAPAVMDLLVRPYAMPFARPTALEDVASRLEQSLGIPVVLDRAALTRLELEPTDSVQLEVKGVRLKTSLQLLLDQVGMTYRAVPEDNLLILTDDRGADDPLHVILDELETLHAEVHDVRDELHALKQSLSGGPDAPTLRKPTIIEEVPELPGRRGEPDTSDGGAAPVRTPARKSRKSA